MTTKQYVHVALVGAAVALGDIAASQFNGRPLGALDVFVCCILTTLVTAKVVAAAQRA